MNAEPLDTADADALDELLESAGWKLVQARLELQLKRDRDQIENTHPQDVTENIRGRIRSLKLSLNLPVLLRDEIKAGLKK